MCLLVTSSIYIPFQRRWERFLDSKIGAYARKENEKLDILSAGNERSRDTLFSSINEKGVYHVQCRAQVGAIDSLPQAI